MLSECLKNPGSFVQAYSFIILSAFFIVYTSFCQKAIAQDTLQNNKKLLSYVDTKLIDRDQYHWSIRAIGSYKDNRFKLSNTKVPCHILLVTEQG